MRDALMRCLRDHRRFLVTASCLLSVVGALLIGSSTALAAPTSTISDPLVVVARDTTMRGLCTITWEVHRGAQQLSRSTSACPAGSVVGTFIIPLSQARTAGEAFVVLPPRNASSSTLARAQQQVDGLVATVAAHSRASVQSGFIRPLIACNSTGSVTASWDPSFDLNTILDSIVNYSKAPDCTMTINQSELRGTFLNTSTYWDHDAYASSTWGRNCFTLTNSYKTENVTSVQTAGFTFQQHVKNGSHCTQFDSESYIDVGRLS